MRSAIRHERSEGLAIIEQCDWRISCKIVCDETIVLTDNDCEISSEIKTPSVTRPLDAADATKGVVVNNTPSLHFNIKPPPQCTIDSSSNLLVHVVLRCTPVATGVEVVWNCVLTPNNHAHRGFEKISPTECVMEMQTDGFVVATCKYSYSFPRYWKGADFQISSVAMSRIL